ncbi:hypothetical protein SASPL_121013 [Salvia splendens]|uniref:SAUR family protein n=1 Tax=Salvia splendens TaxID=180675 RepID=A0A8X8XRU2_SALSN|nr:hypothetical protein SASPL_121013 [Salvia splendens]
MFNPFLSMNLNLPGNVIVLALDSEPEPFLPCGRHWDDQIGGDLVQFERRSGKIAYEFSRARYWGFSDVVEDEGDVDVEDAGVCVVDNVLEHDGEGEVGAAEEGGVAGDVLAEGPGDSVRGGLGGTGAEELGAGEPNGGDAVVLGMRLRHKVVRLFKWRTRPYHRPISKLSKWVKSISIKSLFTGKTDPGYIKLGGDLDPNRPKKGHLVVYVGEKEGSYSRVVVPVLHFNHPLFVSLLRQSEKVYGYDYPGGIQIPCPVSELERVQMNICRSKPRLFHHPHFFL